MIDDNKMEKRFDQIWNLVMSGFIFVFLGGLSIVIAIAYAVYKILVHFHIM